MESYKPFLGAEGYSSSESGWTIYISSPMREDEAECSNNHEEYDYIYDAHRKQKHGMKIENEDSDDSMASDASSGPGVHQYMHFCTEVNHGKAQFKQDKKDNASKGSSRMNDNKQEKKRVDSRRSKK
ncbi:Acetyl-coenzyme A carboxylase carboxyl transferase subunit beta like [Quillaja saponaria]|uniref:Acetyl-coenzyme A carboxylase carboxyl transferase subunit beta like n=1 Tax=Quillaja saponaria TaxID=32244 RepID=A0AAD7VCB0_QUISA|nr:Acetyl-coenzyme A carboxylase carboxyl transferase subunit beta like [Quillaja saponaria]